MSNDSVSKAEIEQQADRERPMAVDDLAAGVPNFKSCSYGTFAAEYALKDSDIVVHFYLPSGLPREYWQTIFPSVLSDEAQDYFQASLPRLEAKYTGEFNSWWFRARGYGHVLDVDLYVVRFFDRLHACLQAALQP